MASATYSITTSRLDENGNVVSSFPETGVLTIGTKDGIEIKSSTFQIQVANPNGSRAGDYEVNDVVEISLGRNGSNTLVMVGEVSSVRYAGDSTNRVINIQGVNRSKKLVDKIIVGESYLNNPKTVKVIVKELIAKWVNKDGDEKPHRQVDASLYVLLDVPNTSLAAIKPQYYYKTVSSAFDQLASKSINLKSDMIWWIDLQRKLHFIERKGDTNSTALIEGTNILNYTLERSIFGVKNFIVINAGKDLNGSAILAYGYYSQGISEAGFLAGYFVETNIAEDVKKQFPGHTNSQIRELVRARATEIAIERARNNGLPKWRGSITVRGNNGFTFGNLIEIIIPSIGWATARKLRIKDIDHKFNKQGWLTTLNLEEDSTEI